MLKLLNKYSVSSALVAAVALGSSQAFATLSFQLTGPGGATTITNPTAGSTITLTLSYTISNATNAGIYDAGGSFVSSDTSGGGNFQNAVLGSNFTGLGSTPGTSTSATVWGSTDPYNTIAFFYARSNTAGASNTPVPAGGASNILGTIDYVVSGSPSSNFTISFLPRDRTGIADQLWQENGVAQDETITPLGVSTGVTFTSGPAISTWAAPAASPGSDTNVAGNWSPSGVPNSNTAQAVFGGSGTTGVVTNSVDHTFNKITFNNSATYNITGAGKIILAGTNPTINATGSGHSIQNFAVDAAATNFIKSGTGSITVGKSSGGGGISFGNAAVSIQAGTLAFAQVGGSVSRHDSTDQSVTTPNAYVVVMNSLTITAGATLDIGDRDLIVRNGDPVALSALIASGLSPNGDWSGTGITSSAANFSAYNGDGKEAVGLGVAGDLGYNYFDGVAVNPGDVLIKYTYYGDADLNGVVDGNDFGNFQIGFSTNQTPTLWETGDWTYQGFTDGNSFGAFQIGFGATPLLGSLSGSSLAAVPEPASLGLLALGAAGLLARRRR